MHERPELDRLSVAKKEQLSRCQRDEIAGLSAPAKTLTAQVAVLTTKVGELERRLVLTSRNSSKPASSGGGGKSHHARPKRNENKKSGGRKRHFGHPQKMSEQPDWIISCGPPNQRGECRHALPQGDCRGPTGVRHCCVPHGVTESQVTETRCACGKAHRNEFPSGVKAPVRYGPTIKAAVVPVTQHHMMPIARAGALTDDLFGLPMSAARVLAIHAEANLIPTPIVLQIGGP